MLEIISFEVVRTADRSLAYALNLVFSDGVVVTLRGFMTSHVAHCTGEELQAWSAQPLNWVI